MVGIANMPRLTIVTLLLLACLFSGCGGSHAAVLCDAESGWLFLATYSDLAQYLPKSLQGAPIHNARISCGRNCFYMNVGDQLVSIDSRSLKTYPSISLVSYIGDDGTIQIRYDDLKAGVSLPNGSSIKISPFQRFGVSQDAKYFYVYSPGVGTCLYAAREPDVDVLSLEEGMLPYKLNNIGPTNLCICFGGHEHKCYFIGVSGKPRIEKIVQLPGGVIDVSPDGRFFLLDDGSDFGARWFVYDSLTRGRHDICFRKDVGMWVNNSLAHVLQQRTFY